ncbi:MAG TPA: glutamine synthetase type III, partial [Rikenellaceae bacterium]|nr:glutamine synthetase type III [Rikenellaceae bacterium]
ESRNILFEGNGYSPEWHQEAERRGLRGIKDLPNAFNTYLEENSVRLFEETGVLTRREVEARYEVMNETFVKKLQIEARVLGDLTQNHIIPTAIKFQNTLIENLRGIKELFDEEEYRQMSENQLMTIRKISGYIETLRKNTKELIEDRKIANKVEDMAQRARLYYDNVLPTMTKIRIVVDKLEMLIDDELWPLPKYRELLFWR